MVITTAPVCRDSTEWLQLEERGLKPPMMEELLPTSTVMEKALPDQTLKCPRCDSSNTKFCYYNNYSLSQPRHFCKTCKRYWTRGGTLRNVPVGGGCRKNKRVKRANTADHANPPSQIEDPTSNAQSTDLNKTTMHSPLFYSLAKSAAAVDINLRFPSLHSQSSLAENLRSSTRNNSDFTHDPFNTIGLNFCGPAGGNQDEDQHVSNFMQEQIAFNPLQTSDLAASSSALLPYFSHMGSSLSLGGINENNTNIGSDVSESQWKLFQQHKLPLTSGLLVPYEELQTLGDGSVLRPENLRSLGSSAVKIEDDQNNKLSQFEWRVPCENPLETGGSDSHLYWNPVVTPWHDLTSYGSSVTPLI